MKKPKISFLMFVVFAEPKCSCALGDFLYHMYIGRISRVMQGADNSDHQELTDRRTNKIVLGTGPDNLLAVWVHTANWVLLGSSPIRNPDQQCHVGLKPGRLPVNQWGIPCWLDPLVSISSSVILVDILIIAYRCPYADCKI